VARRPDIESVGDLVSDRLDALESAFVSRSILVSAFDEVLRRVFPTPPSPSGGRRCRRRARAGDASNRSTPHCIATRVFARLIPFVSWRCSPASRSGCRTPSCTLPRSDRVGEPHRRREAVVVGADDTVDDRQRVFHGESALVTDSRSSCPSGLDLDARSLGHLDDLFDPPSGSPRPSCSGCARCTSRSRSPRR